MRNAERTLRAAAALAAGLGLLGPGLLATGGCTPAPAPVREAAGEVADDVDRGFAAMREENQRRIRQIAESSHEMEEERRRVLERARARDEE